MPTLKGALRRLDPRRLTGRDEVHRLSLRVERMEERNAKLVKQNERLRSRLEQARRATRAATSAVIEVPGKSRLDIRRSFALGTAADGVSILEIGPAHNAIFPRRDGFNTKNVDYLDRDGLVKRYEEFDRYSPDDIEEVDFVLAPGAAMADVIDERFQLVVASHVIEHTTSMIDFLNETARLLATGGVLALVIPDHRYCFDRFRERASISRVIDASLTPPGVHTLGAVIEERLNASRHRGSTAWMPGHHGHYSFVNDLDQVKRYGEEARRGEKYIDTHNWVCTPNHLRLLLHDLHALGFISLREVAFHDTVRHEFFISLSVDGAGPAESREELVRLSENERRSLDEPTFE